MTTFILFLLLIAAALAIRSYRKNLLLQPRAADLALEDRRIRFATLLNYAMIAALVLSVVVIFIGSFVTVSPGQVGVKVLFGEIDRDVLEPGFHFINPLADVVQMDTRTQAYTMSAKENEGQVKGDDAISVLSKDGLSVKLEVTVQYHLSSASAPKVYSTLGTDYVDKIVRPEVRSALRDGAVGYDATDLYASGRAEFVHQIKDKLITSFAQRGLIMEDLLLRDIQLPEKVRNSIDEKISAEQDAQKMQYVLQRETQEAERKRVEARGISDAQTIIAGSLTAPYLQYNYIQTLKELVNSKNSTFVITPFDQKLTPMLNMNSNK